MPLVLATYDDDEKTQIGLKLLDNITTANLFLPGNPHVLYVDRMQGAYRGSTYDQYVRGDVIHFPTSETVFRVMDGYRSRPLNVEFWACAACRIGGQCQDGVRWACRPFYVSNTIDGFQGHDPVP